MENTKTYFNTFRLPPCASAPEIEEVWKRMSRKLHPDTLGGDAEAFKELTEAATVLRDEGRRLNYLKLLRMTYDACPACTGLGRVYSFTGKGRRCEDCRGEGFFQRRP